MASERQIQANRANARSSTGPVTETGKRASSQNATRHNLLSRHIVLKAESQDQWDELRESLVQEFQPSTPNELILVETMAAARWRILRGYMLQTTTLDIETARQDPEEDSDAVLSTLAFTESANCSQALHLLQRYETALDRQYSRALNTLRKIRADNTPHPPPESPVLRNEANSPPPSHIYRS